MKVPFACGPGKALPTEAVTLAYQAERHAVLFINRL